jgi:3-phosphoinositide dependent protein kinase-1
MERDVFAMCNHRNVVKLYKTFSSPENLYYVLEVCPNGELLSHIKKHGSFDVASATYYTADICGGLEHLHQLGIVHRDLKPENILMSADMRCKLTDFGTSKILDDDIKNDWNARLRTQSFVGTPEYIAPELLDARDTCRATDLFALGSIVFQMITGRPPFKAKTEYLTIEKVKALDYQFPEGFPDVPAAFCKALLVRDPALRLGAGPDGYAKLRAHELFAGFDWDGMAADAPPPPISSSGLKERIDARERLAGEQAQGDGGGAASSNGGGGGGAASSSSGLQYLSDEEHDKWRSFLLADEKIIKSGFVYKYKGLSVKKRQLLLTNKPRLIYVSLAKQVVKGEIPWSHDILAVAKNPTSFWIQTPDRKYILQDKDQKDAEGWAKAIEGLKSHLKQQASKKS